MYVTSAASAHRGGQQPLSAAHRQQRQRLWRLIFEHHVHTRRVRRVLKLCAAGEGALLLSLFLDQQRDGRAAANRRAHASPSLLRLLL